MGWASRGKETKKEKRKEGNEGRRKQLEWMGRTRPEKKKNKKERKEVGNEEKKGERNERKIKIK